jgi:prepilin-type N-terminal cleavage/methylation domain-containing protein
MRHRYARGTGFTLIELMMVVAILGIIAAIAIPTFRFFVSRSKTSEASTNINNIFKSAAAYYNQERTEQGGAATSTGHCTVASASSRVPATPGSNKQKFEPTNNEFRALSFSIADLVYYSYGFTSAGGMCGWGASVPALYTFDAEGDLDGDGTKSLFQLATGSDASNSLYHSRGFYIEKESE